MWKSRRLNAERTLDGKVRLVVDGVTHTLTEHAFLQFMEHCVKVVASIARSAAEGVEK